MPRVGDIEYQIVNDGRCLVDGGGAFGLVPRVIWEKRLPPDKNNFVPFVLRSLLVRSEGKSILVDTGYGHKLSPVQARNAGLVRGEEGDLIASLARIGVSPEDIDIVINTHLHSDHCSGNTRRVGDLVLPSFPRAQYVIQRTEWEDATSPNERTRATYLPENYEPLARGRQLSIVDGPARITGDVRTAVARGHTRGHQVVVLESRGEAAIFLGDLATLHYHFERLAWVTAYDVEPLMSIEAKRFWQRWALDRDALLIFQHDAQLCVGKLVPDGRHHKVVPIET